MEKENNLSDHSFVNKIVLEQVHQLADQLIGSHRSVDDVLNQNLTNASSHFFNMFVVELEAGLVYQADSAPCVVSALHQLSFGEDLRTAALNGGGWITAFPDQQQDDSSENQYIFVYPVPGYRFTICAGLMGNDEVFASLQGDALEQNAPFHGDIMVCLQVKPKAEGKETYLQMAATLKKELENTDGFISDEFFESLNEPGTLLNISFWRDEQSLALWRNNSKHRRDQKTAREVLVDSYDIRVAMVKRHYNRQERDEAPNDSNLFFLYK